MTSGILLFKLCFDLVDELADLKPCIDNLNRFNELLFAIDEKKRLIMETEPRVIGASDLLLNCE